MAIFGITHEIIFIRKNEVLDGAFARTILVVNPQLDTG